MTRVYRRLLVHGHVSDREQRVLRAMVGFGGQKKLFGGYELVLPIPKARELRKQSEALDPPEWWVLTNEMGSTASSISERRAMRREAAWVHSLSPDLRDRFDGTGRCAHCAGITLLYDPDAGEVPTLRDLEAPVAQSSPLMLFAMGKLPPSVRAEDIRYLTVTAAPLNYEGTTDQVDTSVSRAVELRVNVILEASEPSCGRNAVAQKSHAIALASDIRKLDTPGGDRFGGCMPVLLNGYQTGDARVQDRVTDEPTGKGSATVRPARTRPPRTPPPGPSHPVSSAHACTHTRLHQRAPCLHPRSLPIMAPSDARAPDMSQAAETRFQTAFHGEHIEMKSVTTIEAQSGDKANQFGQYLLEARRVHKTKDPNILEVRRAGCRVNRMAGGCEGCTPPAGVEGLLTCPVLIVAATSFGRCHAAAAARIPD